MTELVAVSLKYTLTISGGLYSGTGRRSGLSQLGTLRDADGRPYVPGSSIKGVVRREVERLTVDLVLGPRDCLPFLSGSKCPPGEARCPVCRLFGNSSLPGMLTFSNAEVSNTEVSPDVDPPPVDSRHRVRLSRYRGAAVSGQLMAAEFTPGSLELVGSVWGWLAGSGEDEGLLADLGLLLAGMHLVDAVGGHRASGLGRAAFEVAPDVEVDGINWQPRDLIIFALPGGVKPCSVIR